MSGEKTTDSSKQKNTTKKLTGKRLKLFNTMINPEHITKSITEICEIAEVSRSAYYKSIDNEHFVNQLQIEKERLLRGSVIPIINRFKKDALGGSFAQGKALLIMSGDYVELTRQQIESQVTSEMKILMEQEIRAKVEMELTGKGGGPIEIRTPRERIAARLRKLTDEDEGKDEGEQI